MASLKYIVIFSFIMMMLVNDGYTEAVEEKFVRAPVKRAAEKDQTLLEQGKHSFKRAAEKDQILLEQGNPDKQAAENAKLINKSFPLSHK